MVNRKSFALLGVLSLLAASAGFAQEQSLDDVVAKICQQENNLLKILKGHHPIAETYIQDLVADADLGAVPSTDHYFLGKIDLTKGVTVDSFIPEPRHRFKLPKFKNIFSVALLPRGFAQMMIIDGDSFNPETYKFEFVKREFLGEVRTMVFNVTAQKNTGTGRFIGRIWVEDKEFSIVRFNGTYGPAPRGSFFLHFDSWRVNTGPDLWMPAALYVEESDLAVGLLKAKKMVFKAQTRFWGYEANLNAEGGIFTNLYVDMMNAQDKTETADASPVEQLRQWQTQAEDNILARMQKAALVAPTGDVEKVLETVVNNLIVTNNLEITPDVHCRVLLTSPIESFTVGHTIVISRGLLDTLPDEASLAAVLAHELAHVALGHQLDTRFSFNDRMQFQDTETLQNLIFARPDKEESDADEKAMQLLANSPYKDKLAGPGLFLRALAARAGSIPSLTHPLFGGQMADTSAVLRMKALMDKAPELKIRALDQTAALPLGARIKVDPWTGEIKMLRARTVPLLSAREKMQFEVAPIYINLVRQKPPTEPAAPALPKETPVKTTSGQGSPQY